jgi:hypothetical protein
MIVMSFRKSGLLLNLALWQPLSVSLNTYGIITDLRYCFIEFALTATGDVNMCAPSEVNLFAVARPMPLLPPVITAIFP